MKKRNYRRGAPRAHTELESTRGQPGLLHPNPNLLQYDDIAAKVAQQFISGGTIQFESLLSIPLEERIPALIKEYDLARMHLLVYTILHEGIIALSAGVPKKKLELISRTLASHIIASAESDFLSIEDIIVFLHRLLSTAGADTNLLNNKESLPLLLEAYRKERHGAYLKWSTAREQSFKSLGPTARTAGNPTPMNELLTGGLLVNMSWKMSG